MNQVLIFGLLLFQVLLLLIMFLMVSILACGIFTVPWVPTHKKIGQKMFELVELKPGEIVVDFGCGDGSLLLTAVKVFGASKGIGFEIHPGIRWFGRMRALFGGISSKIDLRGGNFFKAELPPADVVATYLFPETQARLEPLLKKYYPSGTRVVSRTFRYPTLPLIKESRVDGENIYFYKIP